MKVVSLRTRIVALMAGVLLVSNIVTVLVQISKFRSEGRRMVDSYRSEPVENVRRQIEQQVEIAHGILARYQDSADDPESRSRQQAAVELALDGIRFGGSGHFFAYQYDGVARVLPTKPGERDDAGNFFVRNLVEVGKVDGLSRSICSAVEEQNATLSDFARKTALIDEGAKEVAATTRRSAEGLTQASQGVERMHASPSTLAASAQGLDVAAEDLDRLSEELASEVRRFRT